MNIRLFLEHRPRLVLLPEKAETHKKKDKTVGFGGAGGEVGN